MKANAQVTAATTRLPHVDDCNFCYKCIVDEAPKALPPVGEEGLRAMTPVSKEQAEKPVASRSAMHQTVSRGPAYQQLLAESNLPCGDEMFAACMGSQRKAGSIAVGACAGT